MKKIAFFVVSFLMFHQSSNAQYLDFARPILDSLCSANMGGRGYVNDGVNKAANYLANQFKQIGLKSFENTYFQNYDFDINTIPSTSIYLDGRKMEEGHEYLIDASCPDVRGNFKLLPFSYNNPVDKDLLFTKLQSGFEPYEALLLKNSDDGKEFKKIIDTFKQLNYKLPLIVRSTSKKLLWTTSQVIAETPIVIFPDTLINQSDEINIDVDARFVKNHPSKNIIGYIPGKKKNTKGYIVFTAHYDHLGMLGKAYFPGASDNASGVSMILNLANHYMKNKVDYPIIFILFSGEEVGLLGSEYFVKHSLFSLNKVKMLLNVDIMGSAEAGITVVNGSVYQQQFDQLVAINKQGNFLPEVKIRGKAANSDHYHFSEAGVPSLFIYSNGGPGFYHDVWDKPNTLTYKNYDNVTKLLIGFANELNK